MRLGALGPPHEQAREEIQRARELEQPAAPAGRSSRPATSSGVASGSSSMCLPEGCTGAAAAN
jgi:hypothetical protein